MPLYFVPWCMHVNSFFNTDKCMIQYKTLALGIKLVIMQPMTKGI